MPTLLLLAPLALAAENGPHVLGNVEVFTSVPTDIGVRGTIEGPGRLRLTSSLGLLPRPYLRAINDVATANEWYKDDVATLVDAALEDALVLRAHAGWRPFRRHGFQLEAGYSWIGLGGGLTGAEIVEADTGYDLSAFLGDDYPFVATASLHRVEASFGWEHVLGGHFLVRWDLGASYTVDATAKVERDFEAYWPFDGVLDEAEDEASGKVEAALQKHVHTPILAVGLGWRFQ